MLFGVFFLKILLILQFIDEEDEDDKDILNFFDDVLDKAEEMEPADGTSQDGKPAAWARLGPLLPPQNSNVLHLQMKTRRKTSDPGDSASCA